MMGESSTRTAAISLKGVCVDSIVSREDLLGMLSNEVVLLSTTAEYDTTSLDPQMVPFLHYAARSLGLLLTTQEADDYYNKRNCNAKMNYFVFNLYNRLRASVHLSLQDDDSVEAASPTGASIDKIVTSDFKTAADTLEQGIETISAIFKGAKTVDSTDIYENSPYSPKNQATDHSPRQPKQPKGDDDKNKSGKPNKQGKPVKAKNIGCIMVQKGIIDLPGDADWPEGEKPLCPAKLRHNSKGCQNPKCSKNHSEIDNWSKGLLDFMKEVVKKADNLTWNDNVATPEILGAKLNSATK